MIEALAGWLGVALLVGLGSVAVLIDVLRQPLPTASPDAGARSVRRRRRWMRRLMVLVLLFTAMVGVATIVRFEYLT